LQNPAPSIKGLKRSQKGDLLRRGLYADPVDRMLKNGADHCDRRSNDFNTNRSVAQLTKLCFEFDFHPLEKKE
jgi:hypothetical protein